MSPPEIPVHAQLIFNIWLVTLLCWSFLFCVVRAVSVVYSVSVELLVRSTNNTQQIRLIWQKFLFGRILTIWFLFSSSKYCWRRFASSALFSSSSFSNSILFSRKVSFDSSVKLSFMLVSYYFVNDVFIFFFFLYFWCVSSAQFFKKHSVSIVTVSKYFRWRMKFQSVSFHFGVRFLFSLSSYFLLLRVLWVTRASHKNNVRFLWFSIVHPFDLID